MTAPDPNLPLVQLGYAPRPPRRRRWARRALRWWPACALATLLGVVLLYGPRLYERYGLLKLQDACLAADLPQDRPTREGDPVAARALATASPAEYRFVPDGPDDGTAGGWAVRRPDPRWAAFEARLGMRAFTFMPKGSPPPTTFCHARATPDGRRRLVVVEDGQWVTVIEPVGWFAGLRGDRPAVVGRERIDPEDEGSLRALNATSALAGPCRFGAGAPDAADPSRFTVPFIANGIAGTWEYRLGDDDRVTVRLLDRADFLARAEAAKAAARR